MATDKKLRTLTPKQEKFCLEILKGETERTAFFKVYGRRGNPQTISTLPKVRARIEELRKPIIEEAQIKIADVLARWIDIALADPNDIVQHRRTCCRYCYGIGHQYQWTTVEYAAKAAQAVDENKTMPVCEGGFDFNANTDPHSDCPECFGHGVSHVYFTDTRRLKGRARALYAGVKKTSGGGMEVLLRNQDAALENIAKFLGMFKLQFGSGTPSDVPLGIPLDIKSITVSPMEASRLYQKIMSET